MFVKKIYTFKKRNNQKINFWEINGGVYGNFCLFVYIWMLFLESLSREEKNFDLDSLPYSWWDILFCIEFFLQYYLFGGKVGWDKGEIEKDYECT